MLDGRETVIDESGTGAPTYVLVHGIGMGRRTWADLAASVARTGRVLALDLPGFGEAAEPEDALTMPEFGAYLAELVAAEAPGERVVLVGHSMGTQIVAETAAQRPELVSGVVLIAPTVNPRERSAGMQALRLVQDVALARPKVVALGAAYYLQAGPRWYLKKLRAMLAHRIELVLPRVAAPVLVVRGERDVVAPRDWCEQAARLVPDGRVAEVPGRGHEAMITGGERVAALIAGFARGEEPGGSGEADSPDAPSPTDGVPFWRAARWWAADYLYAARRQLAVLGAFRRPRHWLRGDALLPEVVLLPGVYEHWSFLRPLGDRLNAAGHRVRTVHGLGVNRAPIADTAARLERALARLPAPSAGRVIVGHSKGGLIGKRLLVDEEALGAGRTPTPLLGVVAVSTPFGGARRARFFLDPGIRAFLPGDPTLGALSRAREVDARVVSIFGVFDPHVPEGSVLVGATNVQVPVAGHFRILGAPDTVEAVLGGITRLAARDGTEPIV